MKATRPEANGISPTEHAAGANAPQPAPLHLPSTPLDDETARLVAALTPDQQSKLAAYRDLLLAWNLRFNLTAISDPDEVEHRLFLDAIRMLPTIDDVVGDDASARLIDIGAGAGFPGLVVAIARPRLTVTLVEATGKKVSFLQAVIETLGLPNATAFHSRAEDLARDPAHRERYDVATARAVAALPSLLELALPFLRTGGRALFPKSADLGEELALGYRAAKLVGGEIITTRLLPHANAERVTRLVIADKMQPTPSRFPRRAGIPAREPLGRGQP
jgi:16S rRNA (guanine527-N7)-methyltransferase